MNALTNEEYIYLQQFEEHMRTAINNNYMRNIQTADIIKIGEIYTRLIGQTYRFNKNCGSCRLTLMKKIGAVYFAFSTQTKEVNDGKTSDRTEEPAAYGQNAEVERNNEGDKQRKDKRTNRKLVQE